MLIWLFARFSYTGTGTSILSKLCCTKKVLSPYWIRYRFVREDDLPAAHQLVESLLHGSRPPLHQAKRLKTQTYLVQNPQMSSLLDLQ